MRAYPSVAGGTDDRRVSVTERILEPATTASDILAPHRVCLGCGCACDDVTVVVRGGAIVEARNACAMGTAWFGSGIVPARACVDGADVPVVAALSAAATLLASARRPLVYLAPDLSCAAQREAVALADVLQAALDSVTSATALPAVLAAQERGRAGATLGEVRHRADLIVYWGVDPAERHARFVERYAPPDGLHLSGPRTSVAVDVGPSKGPSHANVRVTIDADVEVPVLRRLAEVAVGGAGARPLDRSSQTARDIEACVARLAPALGAACYIAIVANGDAGAVDGGRAAAIGALAQALNGPARCALVLLRGGGNRAGADAVLTAQTGYPLAVDFARGVPRYRPYNGTATALLARGEPDAVALVGAPGRAPAPVVGALLRVPSVVIGPNASGHAASARVAIDTGVAGIHEAGTALRLDDVPLPLRPVLAGPVSAAEAVRALCYEVRGHAS